MSFKKKCVHKAEFVDTQVSHVQCKMTDRRTEQEENKKIWLQKEMQQWCMTIFWLQKEFWWQMISTIIQLIWPFLSSSSSSILNMSCTFWLNINELPLFIFRINVSVRVTCDLSNNGIHHVKHPPGYMFYWRQQDESCSLFIAKVLFSYWQIPSMKHFVEHFNTFVLWWMYF